jgi:hypothetical protein
MEGQKIAEKGGKIAKKQKKKKKKKKPQTQRGCERQAPRGPERMRRLNLHLGVPGKRENAYFEQF